MLQGSVWTHTFHELHGSGTDGTNPTAPLCTPLAVQTKTRSDLPSKLLRVRPCKDAQVCSHHATQTGTSPPSGANSHNTGPLTTRLTVAGVRVPAHGRAYWKASNG